MYLCSRLSRQSSLLSFYRGPARRRPKGQTSHIAMSTNRVFDFVAAAAATTAAAAAGPAEACVQHGSAAGSDPAVSHPQDLFLAGGLIAPGALALRLRVVEFAEAHLEVDAQKSMAISHARLTEQRAERQGQPQTLQVTTTLGTPTSLVRDAASKISAGSSSANSALSKVPPKSMVPIPASSATQWRS